MVNHFSPPTPTTKSAGPLFFTVAWSEKNFATLMYHTAKSTVDFQAEDG